VVIGDASPACGVIESVTDLASWSIQADGLLCLRNSLAVPVLTGYDGAVPLAFENSDNVTHLLVSGFTGSVGQDLDVDDDGVLDMTPWSAVVDCVGLDEGTAPNCALDDDFLFCSTRVGPDGTFVPGHVYRCADTQAWTIGPFNPLGATDTPGSANPLCLSPPPDFADEIRTPCVPLVGEVAVVRAAVLHATAARVGYVVNGGPETWLAMTVVSSSGDTTLFQATLPSQGSNGARVEYRVEAVNATPDTTVGFRQGYFVGTATIAQVRVNDVNGANVYRFFGVRVRGNVSVAYGTFGLLDTDYYVQDATGGINVFQFGAHSVHPVLGADVTVAGILDQYSGKLELTRGGTCDTLLVTLNGAGAPPAPRMVNSCSLGEADEGVLVRLYHGRLVSGLDEELMPNKNYPIFNCQPDTVAMRVDGDTNIPGHPIVTTYLNLTGIANQFDSSPPYESGYQIQPRAIGDIEFLDPTGVGGEAPAIRARLLPNAPNPFGSATRIRYEIASASAAPVPVRLDLLDVQGRLVSRLVDAMQAPGSYTVTLEARTLKALASGIHFYRLEVAGEVLARKLAHR
jgi:hypothetical protein